MYNVEKAFTLEVGSTKHENNWYVITREKMIHAQLGKKKSKSKFKRHTAPSIAIMSTIKFRNKTDS